MTKEKVLLAMTKGEACLAMTREKARLAAAKGRKAHTMTLPCHETLFQTTIIAMKTPCVYILANQRNGTLYIGVTSNPAQRIWQHKEGVVEGFTKKYGIKLLVWYELHATMESAITREKQLKASKRARKIRLIEVTNPDWRDLYADIIA
jgi:putative endonuclease